MKFIIGKKLEMTQIWQDDQVVSVTKVEATPNTVVQVKTDDKDGYKAVQLGWGERKEKNIAKPQKGHMKGLGNFAKSREFRIDSEELKVGDKINVSTFVKGDAIDATGTSKGRGFQGVVKRHGFAGQIKTHGNKDQLRMPGSIGATGPAHVFKGMRMPGRMGGEQVTTKNLEIVEVDEENNILFIKGAVPGHRNGLVLIKGEGELKIAPADAKSSDAANEEKKAEGVETQDPASKSEVSKSEEKADKEKKDESKQEEKKSPSAKATEDKEDKNETKEEKKKDEKDGK